MVAYFVYNKKGSCGMFSSYDSAADYIVLMRESHPRTKYYIVEEVRK